MGFVCFAMFFSLTNIPSLTVHCADGWRWQLSSPGVLEPWFAELSHPRSGYVKNLPHRKVFPVRDLHGGSYHVKQNVPCGLPSRFLFRFRHPLYREFGILMQLRREGIPCVRPVGYGCSDSQEILITETLQDCVTALEFWHALAPGDPARERDFLQAYARLLGQLKERLYVHRDFHPENVLYQKSTGRLFLVDPYKLKRCRRPNRLQDILSCGGALFMDDRLTDARLADLLTAAGIAGGRADALELLAVARRRRFRVFIRKYRKRKRKILSGESRDATVVRHARYRLHVRNTPWHAPRTIDLARLHPRRMPGARASETWLDSILTLRKNLRNPPLAWQEQCDPAEDDVLFYAEEYRPEDEAPGKETL